MRPFALHLIDGDVMVLWASKNSHKSWTDAFKKIVKVPASEDGKQKIYLKLRPENTFVCAIFLSLAPMIP